MITKIIGTAILIITMAVASETFRMMQRELIDSTPSNRWFEVVVDDLGRTMFLMPGMVVGCYGLFAIYQMWNSLEVILMVFIVMYILKRYIIVKILEKISIYIHKKTSG